MNNTGVKAVRFTDGEDLANAISHLAGAFLATAALVLMIVFSSLRGTAWHIVSCSVFGASMIFLYSSSTVAHWLPEGKTKDSFFAVDQAAIFLMIAGTYTPLSLVALKGPLGWVLFGTEWGLALFGIIRLFSRTNRFQSGVAALDIILYAGMGWIVVFLAGSVLKNMPVMGFIWIVLGGLFYTIGILFFKVIKFRYHHLVWHLMVMAGSACHFIAIFFYIILK